MLLSNDYCMDFWNVFEFNVSDMGGIYTKRQVIIPLTLVKMERVQNFNQGLVTCRQETLF